MTGKSNIEWTEHTWNPIVGCSIVSPGCTNCYAMKMAARLGKISESTGPLDEDTPLAHYRVLTQDSKAGAVWTGKLALAPDHILLEPLRRKKPTTYFVNSMGDLFHEDAPDEWIDKVFAVMALAPQHTFQVLTKRAERMLAWVKQERSRTPIVECIAELYVGNPDIAKRWPFDQKRAIGVGTRGWPLPNVWLGVSCERQQEADERIPLLLQTPAAVRFISAEPLLAKIDLRSIPIKLKGRGFDAAASYPMTLDALSGFVRERWNQNVDDPAHGGDFCKLDWVIVGGESGPNARPMHPDWPRSLRDQCEAAGVAFFFKQWGSFAPADGLLGALKLGKRSCAIDRDGKLPPGDPTTDAGCDEALKSVVLGDYQFMSAVGKKAAGRLLDGELHDALPSLPSALAATSNKSDNTFPEARR